MKTLPRLGDKGGPSTQLGAILPVAHRGGGFPPRSEGEGGHTGEGASNLAQVGPPIPIT